MKRASVDSIILEKLSNLEEKLERQDTRLDALDKGLAVYNSQLEVHIEGTIQNRQEIRKVNAEILADMHPLKKHVDMMSFAFKTIGLIFTTVVAVAGAYEGISRALIWFAEHR